MLARLEKTISPQELKELNWIGTDDLSALASMPYRSPSSFHSVEWIRAWRDTYSSADTEIKIAMGYNAETVKLAVPMVVSRTRLGSVAKLAANDINDFFIPWGTAFGDPYANSRFVLEALRAASQTLIDVDLVEFERVPLAATEASENHHGFQISKQVDLCHVADMPDTWEETEAAFYGKSTLRGIKRKENQLKKLGELTFEEATSPSHRNEAIQTLITDKKAQLSHLGRFSVFETGPFGKFLQKVVEGTTPEELQLLQLKCDEMPVAVSAILRDPSRALIYQMTYTTGEAARFSPGLVLLRKTLHQLHIDGVRQFDFGLGNEAYKARYANRSIELYRVSKAFTSKGSALMLAQNTRHVVKDKLRSSEMIKSLVQKANSLFPG